MSKLLEAAKAAHHFLRGFLACPAGMGRQLAEEIAEALAAAVAAEDARPKAEPAGWAIESKNGRSLNALYPSREAVERVFHSYEDCGVYRGCKAVPLYREPPGEAEELRLMEAVVQAAKSERDEDRLPPKEDPDCVCGLCKLIRALRALDEYRARPSALDSVARTEGSP